MGATAKALRANIRLRSDTEVVPESGLKVRSHRIELARAPEHGDSWIATMTVLGDLPWLRGTQREVEIRIAAEEFARLVRKDKPSLFVRHGDALIGDLSFENGQREN